MLYISQVVLQRKLFFYFFNLLFACKFPFRSTTLFSFIFASFAHIHSFMSDFLLLFTILLSHKLQALTLLNKPHSATYSYLPFSVLSDCQERLNLREQNKYQRASFSSLRTYAFHLLISQETKNYPLLYRYSRRSSCNSCKQDHSQGMIEHQIRNSIPSRSFFLFPLTIYPFPLSYYCITTPIK